MCGQQVWLVELKLRTKLLWLIRYAACTVARTSLRATSRIAVGRSMLHLTSPTRPKACRSMCSVRGGWARQGACFRLPAPIPLLTLACPNPREPTLGPLARHRPGRTKFTDRKHVHSGSTLIHSALCQSMTVAQATSLLRFFCQHGDTDGQIDAPVAERTKPRAPTPHMLGALRGSFRSISTVRVWCTEQQQALYKCTS